ncbi:MAG: tyrosine phosphatase family-domain-containing protein [Olpidium bornovanus]|uniref:Tyrosine phosphatase family-domain-containing protein n=1 Tax=Olpidium bornovanus TaxID=278681 RepID=A0A8H7ZS69_9FUNG|nr:MAG: tyrosine phosphatase family-domain-containing protein [Olpidium bornovanus]
MSLVTPPDAFGLVNDGVYRSDLLRPAHFGFMRTLNLRTVVVLTPEVPARAVLNFLEENGIKLGEGDALKLTPAIPAWKRNVTWRPVSDELIKEGLELILNEENHPVLIQAGIHETGTFVGCLRKLQGWNFSSIVGEVRMCLDHYTRKYRSYAGSKARYVNEQYIELFDVDLVTLPKMLPEWFASNLAMLASDRRWIRKKNKRTANKKREKERNQRS